MGVYDRDYMSEGSGRGVGSWSMCTWLMIANGVTFLLQQLIFNQTPAWVSLSRDTLFSGEIWRLLTFQFSHADPIHLIFNMLFLFFMGKALEHQIGSKNFLYIYLLGGLVGGLTHIAFSGDPVVGASASVMAIVIAMVSMMPNQPVSMLFIPVQFPLKYLGWFLIGTNVLGVLLLSKAPDNHVSYLSHLGGMAAGWFFVRNLLPILRRQEVNGDTVKQSRGSKLMEAAKKRNTDKKQRNASYLNKKVDAILEKISEQGMQSLTPEEKKVLEQSSEQLSKKLDKDN